MKLIKRIALALGLAGATLAASILVSPASHANTVADAYTQTWGTGSYLAGPCYCTEMTAKSMLSNGGAARLVSYHTYYLFAQSKDGNGNVIAQTVIGGYPSQLAGQSTPRVAYDYVGYVGFDCRYNYAVGTLYDITANMTIDVTTANVC